MAVRLQIKARGKFFEEKSFGLVQNASSDSIFTNAKIEGLTIWYKISYKSANICFPTIFSFLMQTIMINAFRVKKIYNVIYVVHFLITSILHKLDIREYLWVSQKIPSLENSNTKRRVESTEWFGMNQLLRDSREIEVFYEHWKSR